MQIPEKNNLPKGRSAPNQRPIWTKVLTAVVLVGVTIIFIWLLPKGFSQDFSLIGKGANIVVMVHHPHLVDSGNNMSVISRSLRDEYKGRVIFLVADLFTAEGQQFIKTHNIEDTTAMAFFTPTGENTKVLYGPQSEEVLRKNINDAFHLSGQ